MVRVELVESTVLSKVTGVGKNAKFLKKSLKAKSTTCFNNIQNLGNNLVREGGRG